MTRSPRVCATDERPAACFAAVAAIVLDRGGRHVIDQSSAGAPETSRRRPPADTHLFVAMKGPLEAKNPVVRAGPRKIAAAPLVDAAARAADNRRFGRN